jgi:hypothetical protein
VVFLQAEKRSQKKKKKEKRNAFPEDKLATATAGPQCLGFQGLICAIKS